MDILTSVLNSASVRGSVAATVKAGDDWGLELAEVPGAAFHAISSGSAYLEVEHRPPIRLMPGDSVLLASGATHRLSSHPSAAMQPFDHARAESSMTAGGELVVGTPPMATQIVCASYSQSPSARVSPFDALPAVVHVPALSAPPVLRSTLALITDELSLGGPGIRSVLDHAINIVLIQVLRAWIADPDTEDRAPSWLIGLNDPVAHAALTELHADPAHSWTIASLASKVGVSRATLTRRFESWVGQSPGGYITAWRMELAAQRLRESDETIGLIARTVGYASEYSFNRAFTRQFGEPPGRYRRTSQARPSAHER